MANDANRLLGQNGVRELTSADGAITFTGPYPVEIKAINGAAATFTTLTEPQLEGTRRLTSLPSGQTINGRFTVVHVATGAVRCNF